MLVDFPRTAIMTDFLTHSMTWTAAAIMFGLVGWSWILYLHFRRASQTPLDSMSFVVRLFPDNVLLVNTWGRIVASSQPAEAFFGYGPGEMSLLEVQRLIPGESFEEHRRQRKAFMEGNPGKIMTNEVRCVQKSGEVVPAIVRATSFNSAGESYRLVTIQDLRPFKSREQDLKTLSERDPLTGVANRRLFDRDYHREWHRALRNESPVAIIMVDVDAFKEYNDYHGHPGGDACLKTIAGSMSAVINRSTDTLARYGGEEFICLLPGIDESGAESKARELCKSIESANIPHGRSGVSRWVTASAGVAVAIPRQGEDMQSLISAADAALYRAKSSGRNSVQVYSGARSSAKEASEAGLEN